MTYIDRIEASLTKAIEKWRSFGQIAPLALGFVAGVGTTLIL